MPNIDSELRARGGLARVADLLSAGFSRDRIERAAKRGDIHRVRNGVYASKSAPPEIVRAARVGGRLAGVSAARQHGLWAPESHPLVVEVRRSASNLRNPDDASQPLSLHRDNVQVLWHRSTQPGVRFFGLSSLEETLRQVAITQPLPLAVATLDSALRRTSLSVIDLQFLAAQLPGKVRRAFEQVDPRADSGTESVLRVLLALAGVTVDLQVPIPFTDLDRMDMLVGDRLVVECDSYEHHGSRDRRIADLRRDAALACLGFVVLRFDYVQVLHEPETVVAAVLTYISLGFHLGREPH